jgi:Zn-dependent protease
LGIITLHEFGHAFAAHRLGYTVESIWINFIHGRCEFEASEFEWDHVRIAWAGVLAQFAVAIPVLVVASIFRAQDFGYLGPAVIFLGYVNLFIAFLNLAPVAGLDGQVAWRVVPLLHEEWKAKRATKKAITSLAKRR